jgi:probable rRNA maturation factor
MSSLLWDDRAEIGLPEGWNDTLSLVIKLGLEYTDAPENCEISISFVTREEIRAINEEWRKIDSETDVLSFPFCESITKNVPEHSPPIALGDIVICTDAAIRQASDFGHSYMRELAFLTVHGLLHLLGYDHVTEEGEKDMISMQNEILDKAGVHR